jgi:EPS-associated MarR family transcriptional regulator
MLTDEYRYKILKMVEKNPEVSQRELARALGISLGKLNFCLNALIQVGLVKANNFRNNDNKMGYMYLLTPKGIEEKALITLRFLKTKTEEYEALQLQIEELRSEARKMSESKVGDH